MELYEELIEMAKDKEDRREEIHGILMTMTQMQRDLLNYELLSYINKVIS